MSGMASHLVVAGRDGLLWGHALRSQTKRERSSYIANVHAAWYKALRKDVCAYCGRPAGTLDHIVPKSKAPGTHWENRTAACRKCNVRKDSRSLLMFLITHRSYLDAHWQASVNLRTRGTDAEAA